MQQKPNYMKTPATLMVAGGAINSGVTLLSVLNTLMAGGVWHAGLVATTVLGLLTGGVQLAAGIVGLRSRGEKERVRPCIPLGIVVAAMSLLSAVVILAVNPDAGWYLPLAALLLPALYLNSAWQTIKPPPPPLGTPYTGEPPRFGNCRLDRRGRPVLRLAGAIRFFLAFFGGIFLGVGLFATFYTLFVFGAAHLMRDPTGSIVVPIVLDVIGLPLLLALRWRWVLDPAAGTLAHRSLVGGRTYTLAALNEGAKQTPPQIWGRMRGVRFYLPEGGSAMVMFYYSRGGVDFVKALAHMAGVPLPTAFYGVRPN